MARPCEYVLTFRPLWIALSLFCAWPLSVTKGGRVVCSLLSVKVALTTAAFCVSGWRAWAYLQERLRWHRDMPSDDFPLRLLNFQFTIYLLSFFCIAFMILESGRVAKYAARWHEFQPQLQRVCGRSLGDGGLRRRVKYTTLALSVGWPLAIVVPLHFAGEQIHLSTADIVYLAYTTTVLTFCSTNWRMHCAFLRHTSGLLVTALSKALDRDDLSGKEVSRFIRTWMQQREMVHRGAHAVELTMLLNMLILTLSLVLCTYNTMYIVLNGFSGLGIFLTGVGLLTGVTVFRLFNLGHVVNQELGRNTVLALAKARFSKWEGETIDELNAFRLILKANPVRVTFLGYLPVNRKVLGALWATMCTYLVVLVQFTVDQ